MKIMAFSRNYFSGSFFRIRVNFLAYFYLISYQELNITIVAVCISLQKGKHYTAYCKFSPFFSPSSCVFRCERVRINNSTLARDSPWSHEWNLGNNANHLRCDVDPAERNREQERHLAEGKHLAKDPQEVYTHTRPRAGVGPAAPYITMMKHSDQTRANPSFINVTAEAVVEKGSLSPCCPGKGRNTSQHSLTCHTATPSILVWVKRESTAHQSWQGHTNTSVVLLSGPIDRTRH